jgi:long-chain acyl-CoA synthetase
MTEHSDKLPNRIIEVVKAGAARSPNQPALVDASGCWTYREFVEAVENARAALRNAGVRAGDRVMVVSENCRAFAAIVFAISALDAWPVPVNARLSSQEIDAIRKHCAPRRVIYTTAVSAHTRKHAEQDSAGSAEIAGIGRIGLSALNENAVPEPVEQDGAKQVAILLYTSGTTGQPKAVMLTHQNVLFIAAAASRIRSLTPDDRIYAVLPLSHVVGFTVLLVGTLVGGATVVIAPRFDPTGVVRDLTEHRATVMLGVPSMFALLVEYAKSKAIGSFDFPALRVISSSGAPLGLELKTQVERLFGMTLCNGYGITECSPTIAQVRLESPRKDLSVGPPLPGVELKIVGPNGHALPDGEVGELRVRGPNVMKGYYHAPEETAAAIDSEGWFNTRDLARIEDGNLFVIGRTKELIIRFGFNVYPAEVEAVLAGYPGVLRAAVVGRPASGDRGGEEVVAFVQCTDRPKVSPEELLAHAARHLAPYKVPSEIVILPELPLTSTGKIAKDKLAALLPSPDRQL